MNTVDYNLSEIRCDLSCYLKEHKDSMSLEEAGQVVDMIKDLAAADRYSAQACYYNTVVKAMKNEPHNYRMGYIPEPDEYYPFQEDPYRDMKHRPYYSWQSYYDDKQQTYPNVIDSYREARKHYTETHSMDDKRRMDSSANEAIDDSMRTLEEIWNSSDPDLRARMKDNLMKMLNETT